MMRIGTPARLRIAGILAAGLLLATVHPVAAQGVAAQGPVQVAAHQYQLDIAAGWSPADAHAAPGAAVAALSGYRHDAGGARMAITRVDYPNAGAWARKQAFFDEVEHGIRTAAPGCTRLQRRQHRLGRVPAMDVQFRRAAGQRSEVVHMRFLFFRRYTLALTLAAPARAYRRHGRAYRALVKSFVPYFAP